MVHAKNETPATANNAEINIFNFSFIFFLLYLSQRRFIQEITQKSPNNVGVSFINKKGPLYRSHGIYIPLSLYEGSTPTGGVPLEMPLICDIN